MSRGLPLDFKLENAMQFNNVTTVHASKGERQFLSKQLIKKCTSAKSGTSVWISR